MLRKSAIVVESLWNVSERERGFYSGDLGYSGAYDDAINVETSRRGKDDKNGINRIESVCRTYQKCNMKTSIS